MAKLIQVIILVSLMAALIVEAQQQKKTNKEECSKLRISRFGADAKKEARDACRACCESTDYYTNWQWGFVDRKCECLPNYVDDAY